MQFEVTTSSFKSYGGCPSLSLTPDFLLETAIDFGQAIQRLTIHFYLDRNGQPNKKQVKQHPEYYAHLRSLPTVTFQRRRAEAKIEIASQLAPGKDFDRRLQLSLSMFCGGVAEVVAALELLRNHLNTDDDFDLEAFLKHCRSALDRLPNCVEELAAFAEATRQRRIARNAAMTTWDRLDINWEDYHPDARRLLDDPFYWECSDDFAPHGNDAGADLLSLYKSWLGQNSAADSMVFFRDLMSRWECSEPLNDQSELDEYDEAAIALPFAELKYCGVCSPAAVSSALAAILRQGVAAAKSHNWSSKDEYLKKLAMMEAKLASMN